VRSADHILAALSDKTGVNSAEIPPWNDTSLYDPDPVLIQQDVDTVQSLMWNYVGLERSGYRLARARRELRHLEGEIDRFYRVSRLSDELIGLRNSVRAAILVADAAWSNPVSIGCHYRID
jgi:L-aspartate oxidase